MKTPSSNPGADGVGVGVGSGVVSTGNGVVSTGIGVSVYTGVAIKVGTVAIEVAVDIAVAVEVAVDIAVTIEVAVIVAAGVVTGADPIFLKAVAGSV